MKPQPELTAQTRENLMEAFWQIYSNKGIEKTTVREITARAGYNRSTFYAYFTDVYDVLEQIELSLITDLANIHKVTTSIDDFTRMYEKNRQYYVILLGDNGDPAFQSKIKNKMKAITQQTVTSMGLEYTLEMDFALEFALSGMIGLLTYYFKLDTAISSEKLFELIEGYIHRGLVQNLHIPHETA